MRRRTILAAMVGFVWPRPASARQKPRPAVVAVWRDLPSTPAPLSAVVELSLRVTSDEYAPHVTITLIPTAGLELVDTATVRQTRLDQGQVIDVPVRIRCVKNGTWTLGASVSNRHDQDEQVSGAVVWLVGKEGQVTFRLDP